MRKVSIVGIGPGSFEMITQQVANALKNADVIVGYKVYVDLIRKSFPDKEFRSTSMRQEIDRCALCLELALSGKNVCLVCSGDSGVYGMASPMFFLQTQNERYKDIELCVVPGITAANSGAALLGAPLSNDYCVISLSDLMTPWNVIERRLRAAVQGDFAVSIYNPSSHKRNDYLKKACEIMIDEGASEQTQCGYVQNIGRDGTKVSFCTLGELKSRDVDMFTTVFIGNSQTQTIETAFGKRLVTRRGYKI